MLETRNIFIDTECYVRTKLNLENPTFNTFKELCVANELNHITTSTVKLEVSRKISNSIKGAVDALEKFQRNAQILNSLHSTELQPLFAKVEEDNVRSVANQIFNNYLDECNTDIAGAEEIDGEDILARYFERKAPFTKDKDNEFRDCISLLSLKKWLESEENEKSYVVSGDKALESYCEGDENLIYISNLSHMLDLYNQHNNTRTETIKEYLNQNIQQIKSNIEEYINGCDVYNNSTWEDAEVDSFSVVQIDDFETSIIHINDDECQVVFDLSVTIEVSVTGPDYINGIYDKEAGEVYTFDSTTNVSNVKLDFDVDLNITYQLDADQLINIDASDININGAAVGIEVEIEESEDESFY
jgi:hypothetical protein